MSVENHLDTLRQKDSYLAKEIHDAHTHHESTTELKKARLKIQDEIRQCEESLDHAA